MTVRRNVQGLPVKKRRIVDQKPANRACPMSLNDAGEVEVVPNRNFQTANQSAGPVELRFPIPRQDNHNLQPAIGEGQGQRSYDISETPGPVQIRNSNCYSLAAQVELAGGDAVILGNAPDDEPALEAAFRRGLEEDLLIITGGVSVGKFDFVEDVLKRLGAEFYFDAIAIRPGRPG